MNAHAIIKSPQYFRDGHRDSEETGPKTDEFASREAIPGKSGSIMAGSISLGFMDARLKKAGPAKAGSIETLPVKTRPIEAGPVNFGSIEALPGITINYQGMTRPGETGLEKTHKTVSNLAQFLDRSRSHPIEASNACSVPGPEA